MRIGRVFARYTQGMSASQMKKALTMLKYGTDKEREDFFTKIVREAEEFDLNELSSKNPKAAFGNLAYKSRMAGMLSNISGSNSDVTPHITY